MKVRILAAAEQEAREAAQWYESRRAGLGQIYLDALTDALQALEVAPLRFPKLETVRTRRNVRRAVLNRFPYAIIFEILPDEVLVIAVAHLKRRPHYWKHRK